MMCVRAADEPKILGVAEKAGQIAQAPAAGGKACVCARKRFCTRIT